MIARQENGGLRWLTNLEPLHIMKRLLLLAFLILVAFSTYSLGQVGQSAREWKGGSTPSGACASGSPPVIYNGTTYHCSGGNWTAESGGGGGASLAKVTHTVCASGCDYATLTAAVSGIGSSNEAIVTISESTAGFAGTVTKNIQLKFTQTGVLTVANGVVQNINNMDIEAPEGKQIFSLTGTGRVTFGGVDNTAANQTQAQMTPSAGTLRGNTMYASWWGVVADNSTDNGTAIGKIQDIQPSSTKVIWPAGPIRHSNAMFMDNRFAFTWLGSGGHPKELGMTSGPTAFIYTGTNGAWQFTIAKCRNSLIEDIAFFGNRLAVLTDGADGGIYFTNSQGTSGDTDTANTLKNVTVFANAHRSGYVGIRMGEGGGGDAGSNSDHHILEDVYVRADYYDNPVSYTLFGKALYLAHGNVKGINVLRGSLAQADTLIYSVAGNLSVKSSKLFFANRLIEASGGYDPITLDDIDSEYVANGGILGSGVFSLINSRLDRESTFNTLTAISGTPFFNLAEITSSINISNNKLGHWYHTDNASTWGTSNYFFFGGTNAQYCKVKFNQNEVSQFDETKLRTNLMVVANAEYNQERLGHASSGYAQAAGTIVVTTDALPVVAAAVQTNSGEQANAKTTCLAGALCIGGGAMQVSGPFDPNFLVLATKSGTHGGGVTRDFAIVALDAAGAKTKATYPTQVTDLNATLTGTNKIVLDWPDMTGAASYDVLEKNQANGAEYRFVVNTGSSTYDVVANPSGAYTYTRPSYNEALTATIRGQYINIGGTSAVTPLRFLEASANGTNYVGLKAASSLSASTTFTLPSADGTNGQFLKTDGAGVLSFATIGGGGDALVANPLSQFAATTSSQLAGVISDETGSGALVFGTAPTIAGGTHTALTGLGIRSTGAAFDLTLASTEVFTAGRTLTITLNDAARTLNLGGNLTTAAAFTTSGANALTLTTTGTTNVTLPTSGTLATVLGNETFENKTLTAPKFADLGLIADQNGNELIIFDSAASAVNEITLSNAATGNTPSIAATGGDTNINLLLAGKGSGQVYVNGDIAVAQNTAPPFSSVTTGTITGPTTISVKSTTTGSATFDSGTTGAVNLGTGSNAKTVTLGSSTSTATTNIRAGSGNVHITAGNFLIDAGTFTVGAASTITGQANFAGTTSGTVTLTVADAAGTHTIKLPTADGTNGQFLKTDGAGQWSFATVGGGGDALVANPLSQFASTTSAQLAGVISNETGSDALVFATSPSLTTPRIITAINDTNGNELFKVTATASAVNEFTVTNAATGANPQLSGTGGDTDVGLDFLVKGAGVYRFLATTSGPADVRLFEDSDNGTNYASIIAPASMAANRVLTLPDATDTLVGKATTDTLTNKTISGASNTLSNIALTALTSDTSTALGVGSLNIGHASDTTVSRVSAGVLAVEGVNVVTTSSTDTLTNKTIDAEATGNVITLPYDIEFIAAGMNGASGGPGLDLPATNAPAVAVIDGTNQDFGVLDFDATTDESAQGAFRLPTGWTGAIDLEGSWLAAATTGTVRWGIQTYCAADAEVDGSWNTAQTWGDAAKGTTLQRNTFTQTSITTTGCAAGERFHFKFYRDADGTGGTDDMTGDARLLNLVFTIRIAR